jgi:hypothetical protein
MAEYKDHYWFVPNSGDLTNKDQEEKKCIRTKTTLSWLDLPGPHSGGTDPNSNPNNKTLLHVKVGN